MDIPLDPTISPHYLVQFDDGTTKYVPASKMSLLIPKPSADPSDSSQLLPPFLRLYSKITYAHNGQYHKGYLSRSQDGMYRFSYKSHVDKKVEDWGVPLPNLTSNWHELCTEGLLLPGHISTTFLHSLQHPASLDLTAHFVSAHNLIQDCPRSLTALADNHPDQKTWLDSYFEEKCVIQSLDTYDQSTLAEYCSL
jgi:hypothetical protein